MVLVTDQTSNYPLPLPRQKPEFCPKLHIYLICRLEAKLNLLDMRFCPKTKRKEKEQKRREENKEEHCGNLITHFFSQFFDKFSYWLLRSLSTVIHAFNYILRSENIMFQLLSLQNISSSPIRLGKSQKLLDKNTKLRPTYPCLCL